MAFAHLDCMSVVPLACLSFLKIAPALPLGCDIMNVDTTTMSFDAISAAESVSSLCNVAKLIQGANRWISPCHWGHRVIGAMTRVAFETNACLLEELVQATADGGGT